MQNLINAVRRAVRNTRQAALNMCAPYCVCAYATGQALPWGMHYAHSRAGALAWAAQYPAGSSVYVFGRKLGGTYIVASRVA